MSGNLQNRITILFILIFFIVLTSIALKWQSSMTIMYTKAVSIKYPEKSAIFGGVVFAIFCSIFLLPSEKATRRMLNWELVVQYVGFGGTLCLSTSLIVYFFFIAPIPNQYWTLQ